MWIPGSERQALAPLPSSSGQFHGAFSCWPGWLPVCFVMRRDGEVPEPRQTWDRTHGSQRLDLGLLEIWLMPGITAGADPVPSG